MGFLYKLYEVKYKNIDKNDRIRRLFRNIITFAYEPYRKVTWKQYNKSKNRLIKWYKFYVKKNKKFSLRYLKEIYCDIYHLYTYNKELINDYFAKHNINHNRVDRFNIHFSILFLNVLLFFDPFNKNCLQIISNVLKDKGYKRTTIFECKCIYRWYIDILQNYYEIKNLEQLVLYSLIKRKRL